MQPTLRQRVEYQQLLRYGTDQPERVVLLAALRCLPARQRRAVELTSLDGLTYRGAARRLGVSRPTVARDLASAWCVLVGAVQRRA